MEDSAIKNKNIKKSNTLYKKQKAGYGLTNNIRKKISTTNRVSLRVPPTQNFLENNQQSYT